MQSPYPNDTRIRREIQSTLQAKSTAGFDTVQGNWRYREGGTVSPSEAARLAVLYAEEYAQCGGPAAPAPRPWWRFW